MAPPDTDTSANRGRTPLMRQYYAIKERHPKAILLFRMGDFYETFDEDAKTVSRLLGITLTERNNGEADDVPMAGFPHHAVDSHLPKLIRSGLRVAICEQTEDADNSSGKVVDRDVVEVVTPGVSFHDQLLSPKQSNFLAAVHFGTGRDKDRIGFAFIDATTGEFSVTQAGIDSLLARAAGQGDGTYRGVVSRIPDVERRIGPFRFYGRRADDGNDVFPHEDRRELRALRVVSAWIHHSMLRRRHTLDVGVRDEGRRFVRHYLTDLHLTLGSAGAEPKPPWSGHEYLLELDQVLERIATIGLSGGDWAETVVPAWPGVGHFESGGFAPRQWRPEWPNPAFLRCTAADAFWAAKKIRHLSRDDLAAIVSTADYSSPATTNYMMQTLLLRRNAIARAYLGWGGGLARVAVEDGRLTFRDLPARYGYEADSLRRTVTWHVFKNRENGVGQRLGRSRTSRETIPIPPSRARFLRVRLQSGEGQETRVFLRRRGTPVGSLPPMSLPYEVVGIERRGRPADR